MRVSIFSPAKINLFLAVTGVRSDGFHEIVSVAAPLDFGDSLGAELAPSGFTLRSTKADLPTDNRNLVIKAALAFAAATGWPTRSSESEGKGIFFELEKRIPVGAGLGGGSSNAVAALRLLNELSGGRRSKIELGALAAGLGSDCSLFLSNGPVIMRGRGEKIAELADRGLNRIRGRRVLMFKPSFGIGTGWAYGRMKKRGTDYLSEKEAEQRISAWLASDSPLEELLFNNMAAAAGEKFVAIPLLLEKLKQQFGFPVLMSGSGSACFVLMPEGEEPDNLIASIRDNWGPDVWVRVARLV